MKEILHHYDSNHLPKSAEVIVPTVLNFINPKSIVDVGCGLAQWLRVFNNYGVEEILGIDGYHVPLEELYINKDNFYVFDLECGYEYKPVKVFDLAISLEVAEHISKSGSDGYISMLTKLSDRILFSAAVPFQTGENHINEQPHSYWQQKFLEHKFYMLDFIRPIIWNNPDVNWWYRQNIFLLVKEEDILFKRDLIYNGNQLIHPELLNMYVEVNRTLLKRLDNEEKNNTMNFLRILKSLFK